MRVFALLLLGALSGCLDMGPGRDIPRGAYALSSVDGNPVPIVIRDDDEVGRWILRADTIFIHGGGRAERRRLVEVTGSPLQPDALMDGRQETSYRVLDGIIEIGFVDCPINAICTAFSTGEIMSDGFTLTVGLITSSGAGIYRRVP